MKVQQKNNNKCIDELRIEFTSHFDLINKRMDNHNFKFDNGFLNLQSQINQVRNEDYTVNEKN